jgi:hypothetical protein
LIRLIKAGALGQYVRIRMAVARQVEAN